MAIKVIIERSVSPDNQNEVAELLKELRTRAIRQPGYISGETLFSVDRPGTHVVIGTWETLRDWKAWESNPKRLEIVKKIDKLLTSSSKAVVYATAPRAMAEAV